MSAHASADTDAGKTAASAGDPSLLPAYARAARYAALVREVESLVRNAADDCLLFDSSPLSFDALKREQETGR